MHKRIIAANWKMNKTLSEGLTLVAEVRDHVEKNPRKDLQVIVLPPFIHLAPVSNLLIHSPNFALGAQHCHQALAGPFTGEISAPMLASIGVRYVLAGHSERRQHFGETNHVIAQKIDALLGSHLHPIFCCGEPLSVREKHQEHTFVRQQLTESVLHLSNHQIRQLIIAYEPCWAIGTGLTPEAADIQAMQYEIRDLLARHYGTELATAIPILYGGSCNAHNVPMLINLPGIHGVLMGGACLHSKEFIHTLNAVKS